MSAHDNAFLRDSGAEIPLIGGAMYPCSNAELVGAVSAAGGIGIVQPISLTYVHGHELREGLRLTRELARGRPIGFNALVEASSKVYLERMRGWVEVALDEGLRFFVTGLGKPDWVAEMVHAAGGVVYHDVTERKWAERAIDAGVDGLICVNSRAGGHAGTQTPEALYEELADLGLPLVCAGGVGDAETFARMLGLGYQAVQIGTRLIATEECSESDAYKQAICEADADDIVLTERLSGVPVSVIRTPYVEAVGTRAGPLARWLLGRRWGKHWVRAYYSLRSLRSLKRASQGTPGYDSYLQAGKSVDGVHRVEPVADIIARFAEAWRRG